MNRSKIEWCDHTWNPITGCWHNCEYCYARKMSTRFAGDVRLNKMAKKDYFMLPAADSKRKLYVLDAPMLNETGNPLVYPFGFEPTFHRYRQNMLDKLKMGNNIFVGAMADIWGTWVPDDQSSGKQNSEPEADVEALLLNDGTEWRPTEALFAEYVRLYPKVDVKQQFNEMRCWCLPNPQKRKTKKGIKRFVNSWLAREQDKGESKFSGYNARNKNQFHNFEKHNYDIKELEKALLNK